MGLSCAVLVRGRWFRLALVTLVGACGGAGAWHAVALPPAGECAGLARLVSDPAPLGRGVKVVVVLDGSRHEVVAHGQPAWRLARRAAGEVVWMEGRCAPISGPGSRYDRISHVVSTLKARHVSEGFSAGSRLAMASNRVRSALVDGVTSMPAVPRSLFMGLVIGDDRAQPREMVVQFRRSGLSHLCAVSGQNVAYLLAAAAPLLRRRQPHVRWMITIGLIGWFTLLTRAEPSVLRAGVMAALVATTSVARVGVNARVVLCATVCVLLVIDPMLAWNIGFALSVGATAGLAWVSAPLARVARVPWLGRRVRGLDAMVASTLAAQFGTMPVSLFVFGSVPVVSLVANPLALGVAGAVMTVGLPVALLASVMDPIEPLTSLALSIPVRWVAVVARLGATLGPTGRANFIAWAVVVIVLAATMLRARDTGVGTCG